MASTLTEKDYIEAIAQAQMSQQLSPARVRELLDVMLIQPAIAQEVVARSKETAKARLEQRKTALQTYGRFVKEFSDNLLGEEKTRDSLIAAQQGIIEEHATWGSNAPAQARSVQAQVEAQETKQLGDYLVSVANNKDLLGATRAPYFSPAAAGNYLVADEVLGKFDMNLDDFAGLDDDFKIAIGEQSFDTLDDDMDEIEDRVNAKFAQSWDALKEAGGLQEGSREYLRSLLVSGAQAKAHADGQVMVAKRRIAALQSGNGLTPGELADARSDAAIREMKKLGMGDEVYSILAPLSDEDVNGSAMALTLMQATDENRYKEYLKLKGITSPSEAGAAGARPPAGSRGGPQATLSGGAAIDGYMRAAMMKQEMRANASKNPVFVQWAKDRGLNFEAGQVPTQRQFNHYMRAAKRAASTKRRGTGRIVDMKVDRSDVYGVQSGGAGIAFFVDQEGGYVRPEDVEQRVSAAQEDSEQVPVVEFDLQDRGTRGRVGSAMPTGTVFSALRDLDRKYEKDPEEASRSRLLFDRKTGRLVLLDKDRKVVATQIVAGADLARLESYGRDNRLADPVGDAAGYRSGASANALQSLDDLTTIGLEADLVAPYVPADTQLTYERPVETVRAELGRAKAGDAPRIFVLDPETGEPMENYDPQSILGVEDISLESDTLAISDQRKQSLARTQKVMARRHARSSPTTPQPKSEKQKKATRIGAPLTVDLDPGVASAQLQPKEPPEGSLPGLKTGAMMEGFTPDYTSQPSLWDGIHADEEVKKTPPRTP